MVFYIDCFAGPGGFEQGIRSLGITSGVGYELDPTANATAKAAGHRRIQCDLSRIDLSRHNLAGVDVLLHLSPPCQGFSMAGGGAGRQDAEALIRTYEEASLDMTIEEMAALLDDFKVHANDARSALTLEPLRWAAALRPAYVSLEQVPAVLPIWEAFAGTLRRAGYSVWVGNVQAEQYGVPQTRKRAILLASRDHEVTAPVPTHSRFHNRAPGRLDPGVLPWVSMAEALGWGMTERPSMTVTGGGTATGGAEPFGNAARQRIHSEKDQGRFVLRSNYSAGSTPGSTAAERGRTTRQLSQPATTITSKPPHWLAEQRERVAAEVEPRVNNQSGTPFDLSWPMDRPSPVVAGREIVTMPGANANRFNGATKSRNDGIRVTPQEAGILQTFPADYPWQGNKGQQYQQVGNAYPPMLAAAMVRHLLSGAVAS